MACICRSLFLLCFFFPLFRNAGDAHGGRPPGRFCFSLIFDRLGGTFCCIGGQGQDPLILIPGYWPASAGVFLTQHFERFRRPVFFLSFSTTPCGGCLFSFPAAGAPCRFLPCCLLPFMAHIQWVAGNIPESVPGEPAFSCRIAGDGVSQLFQAVLKSWMRTCGS